MIKWFIFSYDHANYFCDKDKLQNWIMNQPILQPSNTKSQFLYIDYKRVIYDDNISYIIIMCFSTQAHGLYYHKWYYEL